MLVDPVVVAEAVDPLVAAVEDSLVLDPRLAINCINIADMAFDINDPLVSIDDEDVVAFEVAYDAEDSSSWDEVSWFADVWDRNR